MAVSYNSDYWKWQEGEESKVESNGNICYETGCENLSNMGWCVPCRQKEAAEHQAKVDAYVDDLDPCEYCDVKGCGAECYYE